jgi:hypothetical protein
VNIFAVLHKRLDSAVVLVISLIAGHLIDYTWNTATRGTTERQTPTTT